MGVHVGNTRDEVVIRESGRLSYRFTNMSNTILTIGVLVNGISIVPKNLRLGVGEMLQENDILMPKASILKLVTSGSIDYYIAIV